MNICDIKEPITCDVSYLVEKLNITREHVARLARQGVLIKQKRGQYNLIESIVGYARYFRQNPKANPEEDGNTPNWETERTRLAKAKADIAETHAAIVKGVAHHGEAISFYYGQAIANAATRLRAIGPSLAPVVAEMSDPGTCNKTISEAIDQAMEEISRYNTKPIIAMGRKIIKADTQDEPEDDEE